MKIKISLYRCNNVLVINTLIFSIFFGCFFRLETTLPFNLIGLQMKTNPLKKYFPTKPSWFQDFLKKWTNHCDTIIWQKGNWICM